MSSADTAKMPTLANARHTRSRGAARTPLSTANDLADTAWPIGMRSAMPRSATNPSMRDILKPLIRRWREAISPGVAFMRMAAFG